MAGAIALVLLVASAALLPMALRSGSDAAVVVVEKAGHAEVVEPVSVPQAVTPSAVHAMPEGPGAPQAAMGDAMASLFGSLAASAEAIDSVVQELAGAVLDGLVPDDAEPVVERVVEEEQADALLPAAVPVPSAAPAQIAGLLIDVNTASAAELELLPGIGPAMAARIIEDRQANGLFASLDDLDRVRGIGPRTIDNLRSSAAALNGQASAPVRSPAAGAAKPVNLNRATAEELETLPGIGPAMAARIIEERRANGPYASVEDLQRVRGIGPKTIESLRSLVIVTSGRERRR